MAEFLLTSVDEIKTLSNISENVDDKYILPALREAQEINLKSIVGTRLLSRLKELAKSGEIDRPENVVYKETVDRCGYYLIYQTITELPDKLNYKITNLGVVKTRDENVEPVGVDEISRAKAYYQAKADFYCLELQKYLMEHREEIPELTDIDCRQIGANLYSAATCGLWLGGTRGRRWL